MYLNFHLLLNGTQIVVIQVGLHQLCLRIPTSTPNKVGPEYTDRRERLFELRQTLTPIFFQMLFYFYNELGIQGAKAPLSLGCALHSLLYLLASFHKKATIFDMKSVASHTNIRTDTHNYLYR